jgi:hypothetical protein
MSLADKYCANMIRQLGDRKTISQEELDEYVNNAKDMDMSNVRIILCLQRNNITVKPSYVRKPLSMKPTDKSKDFDNMCQYMVAELNGRTTISQNEFDIFVNASNGLSRFEVLKCLREKGIRVQNFTPPLPPSVKPTPAYIRQPPSVKPTPAYIRQPPSVKPTPAYIRQPPSPVNNKCENMVRAWVQGKKSLTAHEYQELVANGIYSDMSQKDIDDCLRKHNISVEKWTNPLDNPAFHDDNVNNPVCPHRVGQQIKVGNPLKQNEECKKCMYNVTVGDKNEVYCDDEVTLNKKYLKYKSKYLELKKKLNL